MTGTMLIDTREKMKIRQRQLYKAEIDRLLKQAVKKGKGSAPFQILENKFGFDGDFSPIDWGNEPENKSYLTQT